MRAHLQNAASSSASADCVSLVKPTQSTSSYRIGAERSLAVLNDRFVAHDALARKMIYELGVQHPLGKLAGRNRVNKKIGPGRC